MVSGDVVNTASRLQSAAPPDSILVDETTYRSTEREIAYEPAEPVLAKGKESPVPVWAAVAARSRFGVDVVQLGRTQLVIAGFMTHMCVSSTARAALDLGYKATVAADAAATRDLPDPMGGVITADALHRAALAELADRFAIVATVDGIPGK